MEKCKKIVPNVRRTLSPLHLFIKTFNRLPKHVSLIFFSFSVWICIYLLLLLFLLPLFKDNAPEKSDAQNIKKMKNKKIFLPEKRMLWIFVVRAVVTPFPASRKKHRQSRACALFFSMCVPRDAPFYELGQLAESMLQCFAGTPRRYPGSRRPFDTTTIFSSHIFVCSIFLPFRWFFGFV